MAIGTVPWQALQGVWEKQFCLSWRCWPPPKKHPQRHTTNKKTATGIMLHVGTLHQNVSATHYRRNTSAVAEQHWFCSSGSNSGIACTRDRLSLRQSWSIEMSFCHALIGGKIQQSWACQEVLIKRIGGFVNWVMSPVTRFLITPWPPVWGPEV